MAKSKKQPNRPARPQPEASTEEELRRLTDLEERISLTCLRYFRGDWDLYLDFLAGTRATEEQRRVELPVVERLRERDERTGYLELLLEDEVVAAAEHMDFDGLLHLWELAILLDPYADPFFEPEGEESELGESDLGGDAPRPRLH
jgi:hypothetical protein